METLLRVAIERGKRFDRELKNADGAMRAELLAAWKELIMEEMVKVLKITKDTLLLRILDSNIAMGLDSAEGRNPFSSTKKERPVKNRAVRGLNSEKR